MSDIQTLNGSVLLNTDPASPGTALSLSRTDAAMTSQAKSLAQISMSSAGANNFQGVMTFSTTSANAAGDVPAERMRIHANGNIGIGASNPGVQFAVGGNGGPVYGTGMWVEYNLHVQGIEGVVGGGRARLRVGTAWGYAGLYSDATSTGLGNDLVLGGSSGTVRIGPEGTGQNLRVCGSLFVAANATVNGRFLTVTGAGNELAYIGGDGVSADMNIGSFNATIPSIGFWNFGSNSAMELIARKFTVFSDRRLKNNIEPITAALQKICNLRGVSYDLVESQGVKGRHLGLIAQDVKDVAPEAVSTSRGMMGVDYSALISVLVEAVKELDAKVETLKAIVTAKKKA